MEILQPAINFAKDIASKLNPIISWISGYIANLAEIPEHNVHMILVFLLAFWLGKFGAAEKFTLKHLVISIIIFLFLIWLGI